MQKRYTDEQKSNLLTRYHEVRKSGVTAEKAAKKVGVHYKTILRWENQAGKPKVTKIAGKKKTKKTAAVRTRAIRRNAGGKKVRKRTAPATIGKNVRKRTAPATMKTGGIVLVTPGGFRIEGIAPRDIVRVIKELK